MTAARQPAEDRRHRPRRFVVRLLAVSMIWVVLELIWVWTGRPAPRVDYGLHLETLAAERQPPGENGWPLFVEAAALAKQIEEQVIVDPDARSPRNLEYMLLVYPEESAPQLDLDLERRILELMRDGGVETLLDRAAACPRVVRPMAPGGPLYEVILPQLGPMRLLAVSRVAAMQLAASAGDGPRAARMLEQALALARATGSQPFIVDRLASRSIQKMAFRELRFRLMDGGLDEATCRLMLEVIDRQAGALPPLDLHLEAERCYALDAIQTCFTDDGHGDGVLNPEAFSHLGAFSGTAMPGSSVLGSIVGPVHVGRAETTELLEEFFDGLRLDARLNAAQRDKGGFNVGSWQARLTKRHVFLQILASTFPRLIAENDDLLVMGRGTVIMLALEAYRQGCGAYPQTLEELVPDLLEEVPLDPTHGGPFVYRRLEPGAGSLPYLLYSTGVDGVDDASGQVADDAAAVSVFGQSVWDKGFDVLINSRRATTGD